MIKVIIGVITHIDCDNREITIIAYAKQLR
jgi:hypothetical protein